MLLGNFPKRSRLSRKFPVNEPLTTEELSKEYGDFKFARDDERIRISDLATCDDVLMELHEARALRDWLAKVLP